MTNTPWKAEESFTGWLAAHGLSGGLRGDELGLFILNVLNEEGRPLDEKAMVLSLVEEIVRSDFWKEVEQAKEKYVEVPFSLRLQPGDLGLPPTSGEMVILSGAIDLVYKSDGGWTIVDYKTDDVRENPKRLCRLLLSSGESLLPFLGRDVR